ncbi:MAG TPA: sulfite exporter TauE/SafE family protein [Chlorobaculum sp.]|uniref:Probable membrane transporter protein n=1 Tax=Chlorobaculum tepidum (strain ATCC 49652 / DSM 12025 / NBRC 103806 / TLS) TaxID=194439 RepID=Q8KEE7_CHLTE|nr:sulfite exporter TauE/SafE family protein [Chlorobaculum tepidum]AAM71979.1 membrane protein, putative [Chlorobaculum tepidum TLS]HBU22899.1 sulfite exporter TauE/SafE family protein [Chlorobaculum sp.]
MNNLELSLIVGVGALFAGMLGSLTGLGGGVVIVPLLTLGLGIDLRYAVGTSLVAVIATSSGAAAAYVKEGFSNIRIGLFLEVATTVGALVGAFLAGMLATNIIAIIFGLVLLYSAYLSTKAKEDHSDDVNPDPLAIKFKLNSSYPTEEGVKHYSVHNVGAGFGLMWLAGILSGLLGIGSGAVKVLAMDHAMRLPFKVSATTSNFMIGVTAAASAGVYFQRGYINAGLTFPVMLGILAGSFIGAKLLMVAKTKWLRLIFGVVIFALGLEMIFNGITGRI